MKRISLTFAAVMLVSAVVAGVLDSTLSISTPGPDTYADGTTVLDGEYYALVYVLQGKTFGGLSTDGNVVDVENNRIVCKEPLAKGGRCQETLIQVADGFLPQNGTFSIVLLDTRTPQGTVGGIVRGYSVAALAALASSDGSVRSGASAPRSSTPVNSALSGARVATPASLPAGTPTPVITDMSLKDGKVKLTVEQTSKWAYYSVTGAATLDGLSENVSNNAVLGSDTSKITIETEPPAASSGFFKVNAGSGM